jgi:hypothetical protein
MSTLESNESAASEARQTTADTLSLAQSAVKPSKAGIGQKIALATTAFRLARRYPVPAVVIGGIALAYYLSRRRARSAVRTQVWH